MTLNPKTRERIRTVLFMCGITLVFTSAVAALHLATAEAVARNASLYLQRAVLAAGGVALPQDSKEIPQVFAARVSPRPGADQPGYFEILDPASRTVRGYAFVRTGAGLWGTITAVVGLEPDLQTVTGIMFTDQNETPGLGARISEEWFQEQFRGRRGPLSLAPEGTRSADPGKIDGITGATITSSAVRDLVNRAIQDGPNLVAPAAAPAP